MNMNDFVDRIDFLLKQKKLSRVNLNADCGLPKNLIAQWKQRGTIPSADIAVKIANYLNTSVEYLVTGSEPGIKTKIPEDLQEIINKYAE